MQHQETFLATGCINYAKRVIQAETTQPNYIILPSYFPTII